MSPPAPFRAAVASLAPLAGLSLAWAAVVVVFEVSGRVFPSGYA